MKRDRTLRAVDPEYFAEDAPTPASGPLNDSARGRGSMEMLVGDCVQAQHPTLQGRALVRWTTPSGISDERWVPMLLTVTVRPLDRVLLAQPSNLDEPVIVGVLDGFAQRPERSAVTAARISLAWDEAIRVDAPNGDELLELRVTEAGPVVKLLGSGVALNLPGRLSISAQSVELNARQGQVAVRATDDVVVEGATVRLN